MVGENKRDINKIWPGKNMGKTVRRGQLEGNGGEEGKGSCREAVDKGMQGDVEVEDIHKMQKKAGGIGILTSGGLGGSEKVSKIKIGNELLKSVNGEMGG